MSKQWDALVAYEALLKANLSPTTDLNGAEIGVVEDLFHQKKFGGNLPFAALEWMGDLELSEGPDDSDEEPIVPFIARVTVIDKTQSSKENRRLKVQAKIEYVAMIKNIAESDLTFGGNAIDYFTKVGDSRDSERLESEYWGVEIDVLIYVRVVAGSR